MCRDLRRAPRRVRTLAEWDELCIEFMIASQPTDGPVTDDSVRPSPEAPQVSDGAKVTGKPHYQQDDEHNPERRPAVDADARVAVAPAAENGGDDEQDDEQSQHCLKLGTSEQESSGLSDLLEYVFDPTQWPVRYEGFLGWLHPWRNCPCGSLDHQAGGHPLDQIDVDSFYRLANETQRRHASVVRRWETKHIATSHARGVVK